MATEQSCDAAESQSEFAEDSLPTTTSLEQAEVEKSVASIYSLSRDAELSVQVHLLRLKHLAYLNHGIRQLSVNFECLDASRPWLCYWILHSLSLLGQPISTQLAGDVVGLLSRCQSPTGGFGGGPGQLPHLAPTYAAVLALCTLATREAYDCIDRPGLQRFLLSLHQENGSFVMHEDGEEDIRGVYCALVPAFLTNIMSPDLCLRTPEWVGRCQTYEGGFSAVPGTEAHGGYTFCGFAASLLMNDPQLCDIQRLLRWVSRRQMKVEGGFQGRTNKLVDGCYSFWQGGVLPLLYLALKEQGDKALHEDLWHFNQEALQEYVLYCCQNPHGGLIDKPGKHRDFYHTCYCLSGLSVAQHCYGNERLVDITHDHTSVLKATHPLFNILPDRVELATDHFSKLPVPKLIHENL